MLGIWAYGYLEEHNRRLRHKCKPVQQLFCHQLPAFSIQRANLIPFRFSFLQLTFFVLVQFYFHLIIDFF
jgi:hypothetical protein